MLRPLRPITFILFHISFLRLLSARGRIFNVNIIFKIFLDPSRELNPGLPVRNRRSKLGMSNLFG